MPGMSGATGGLAPSVRLVQRLGGDGVRGSALEALRTDGAAGNRTLGRGSVRPSGGGVTGPSSGSGVQQQGASGCRGSDGLRMLQREEGF